MQLHKQHSIYIAAIAVASQHIASYNKEVAIIVNIIVIIIISKCLGMCHNCTTHEVQNDII